MADMEKTVARQRIQRGGNSGAGGAGGRAQAAGHVYRLHQRLAACTIWSTRSWTTPSTRRWPATAPTSPVHHQRRATPSPSRTTAAASPWTSRPRRAGPRWRWCSPCSTPAASSAAAATRSPAASTAWAPAWSTPCREWLTVQVHKDGKIYEMKFSRGNITQEMTDRGRDGPHRHHRHLQARPGDVRRHWSTTTRRSTPACGSRRS